jgi:hypothetical protein
VGKTTAAAILAERLGATHLRLDTIAQASQDPRVRRFQAGVDGLWSLPATHLCNLLIAKGDALAPTLDAMISKCSAGSSITVLEGEGVHPTLAAHHPSHLVRFAFVLEPEEAVLVQTLTRRSARFRALPAAHQHTVAAMNWLYGNWLRQQSPTIRPALAGVQTVDDPARPPDPGLAPAHLGPARCSRYPLTQRNRQHPMPDRPHGVEVGHAPRSLWVPRICAPHARGRFPTRSRA